MGFGHVNADGNPVVTNSLLQGGIVSAYYVGTLVGALFGGWIGEKIGRIKSIAIGAAWAIVGASLQCSAQNHNWMICARVSGTIPSQLVQPTLSPWIRNRGVTMPCLPQWNYSHDSTGIPGHIWLTRHRSSMDLAPVSSTPSSPSGQRRRPSTHHVVNLLPSNLLSTSSVSWLLTGLNSTSYDFCACEKADWSSQWSLLHPGRHNSIPMALPNRVSGK